MRVLKIGGNELNDPEFLPALAGWVAETTSNGESLVIVHGGGSDIASMQSRLGLEPKKVDGLRITDSDSLTIAQMVLSGHTNKQIVTALLVAGVDAVGLSGVDGRLLTASKKSHPTVDLGLVGEIVDVRADLLLNLSGQGITAVISPISIGQDNLIYNLNADVAASAIALGVQADLLDFISNVPGVLDGDVTIPVLTPAATAELIEKGIIYGGMIPKVEAARYALRQGAPSATIASGMQEGVLLQVLNNNIGTKIVP